MRTMLNRIRRLEEVAAPAEREHAAVEAILDARRRRLGADYQPMTFAPGSFDGCTAIADQILRARKLANCAEHLASTGLPNRCR